MSYLTLERRRLDHLVTSYGRLPAPEMQRQSESWLTAARMDVLEREDIISQRTTPLPNDFQRHLTRIANVALLCLLSSLPTLAYGAPSSALVKRGSSTVKTVVPIVVICSVAALLLVLVIIRRGLHNRMGHWVTHAAAVFGPSTGGASDGPRELTAQQLASTHSLHGDQAQQPANGTAAQPTRRTRRPNRRTPSQVSTRSLPAYMKEPGEQELVIYRGPEDMEDMPLTTTNVVMPVVAEAPEASTVDLTEQRVYVTVPESPQHMPLLAGDESVVASQVDMSLDNSRSRLISPHRPRPTSSTISSSEEGRTLEEHLTVPESDPRGEAPPYFEFVQSEEPQTPQTPDTPVRVPASPDLSTPPDTPDLHPPTGSVRQPGGSRLSGILNMFHTRPATQSRLVPSAESSSSGHRRDGSDESADLPNVTRHRAASRATMHRPSFSGSGSMFSVMTRSRSRLVEHQNLTSPSTISTGPTPEQVKLISSREAFQRFGMPYGHDAVAFAASSSRLELSNVPPPDFEDVPSSSRFDSPRVPPETVVEEPASGEHDGSSSSVVDNNNNNNNTVRPASPEAETVEATASSSNEAAAASAASPAVPSIPPGLDSQPVTESSESSAAKIPVPIQASTSSSSSPMPSSLPRSVSRASTALSFATAEESIHATPSPSPLSSPSSTPYTSVSSRTNVPQVTVHSEEEEEEDEGVATPLNASEPSTPRTAHKATLLLHDRDDDDHTSMTTFGGTPVPVPASTSTAPSEPETVSLPVVVAH
ncbi:hypothetical protein BC835DRAFT_462515 [Cytidiella melzeri]|nr:hypothetical protein BC835DRAFT_462515 [Cytidiella melzeri]